MRFRPAPLGGHPTFNRRVVAGVALRKLSKITNISKRVLRQLRRKPLYWMGNSLGELKAMPEDVKTVKRLRSAIATV